MISHLAEMAQGLNAMRGSKGERTLISNRRFRSLLVGGGVRTAKELIDRNEAHLAYFKFL